MVNKNKIEILCTGEITVDYRLLKELQLTESGDKLKKTSDELINKLAYSIQKNGIINNLQVWQDGNDFYCFDAHHRQIALKKLEDDGFLIPEIPATRCLAKTKKEAKKLLLLKESKNSWIDEDIIQAYIDEVVDDIDLSELDLMVNFDGIDLNFEAPDFQPSDDEAPRLDQKAPTTCPECGYQWTK